MSAARNKTAKEAKANGTKAALIAWTATKAAVTTFGFAFVYHALTSTWPAVSALSMLYVFAFVAVWLLQRLRVRPRRT